jgi:hypothetical protein
LLPLYALIIRIFISVICSLRWYFLHFHDCLSAHNCKSVVATCFQVFKGSMLYCSIIGLFASVDLKPDSQLVILLMIFSSWQIQMSGLAYNWISQVYVSISFACYSSSDHPLSRRNICRKRFAGWEPELR